MIGKKQEPQPQQEQPQLSKEEYAAMKQAEREEVWSRVNAQADSVFKDDESMKGFLNFMANCTPQSTRNLLILYEQNPEITHPRTFDKWKEAGRSIRSGEKGYTFFAEQEYEKDGIKANGYTITKAYDISQTRGPQPLPPQKHLPEEIIAAMVEQSPVQLAISDQLPQGVQAQYVPKQRTIFVRNGMDETATICAIAREQAHASFDAVGSGYYRQAYAAQAYCAAYVAAQKFGLDTSVFQFDKVCHSCAQLTPEEKRGFIGDVKRAAYSINRDVQRSFRDLEQAIQPDEFSVAAPKPAKAAKAKAEKEPER
ncbi:Uncharacterised protein [uncultured Ruminococcus sp.]|uniref:ArdC family protein n=1 Tax=Hydrogeniiclostridium mannosilyticum TaxID=2764322 RepID=UPI000820EFDC|nr:ArdC family protein [Hydrogeniiclostridium mannosilyticum]SCH10782.1 Uncharacterised protein [uncultured Ruminococcus sp.]